MSTSGSPLASLADARLVQIATPDALELTTWAARLRDGRIIYQFERTPSGNLLRVSSVALHQFSVVEIALGIFQGGVLNLRALLAVPEGATTTILYQGSIDVAQDGAMRRGPRSIVAGWRRFEPEHQEQWIALGEDGRVDQNPRIRRAWPKENPRRVRKP